jgi:hypothetical protein
MFHFPQPFSHIETTQISEDSMQIQFFVIIYYIILRTYISRSLKLIVVNWSKYLVTVD